jgi:clan AA aspartic protease (TIGR02281 family)
MKEYTTQPGVNGSWGKSAVTNNDNVKTGRIAVRAASAVAAISVYLLLACAFPAAADFFQYTDKDGTVVIVDDEGKIPEKYRKKTKTTKSAKSANSAVTAVKIQNNNVFVPVTLCYRNKSVEVTMLLDTGASTTIISIDVAKRLGIAPESTELGISRVADGRLLQTFVTSLDYLSVGPKVKSGLQVSIMPSSGPPLPFDGLLGMNFLGDFNYQLDVNNEMINWMQ